MPRGSLGLPGGCVKSGGGGRKSLGNGGAVQASLQPDRASKERQAVWPRAGALTFSQFEVDCCIIPRAGAGVGRGRGRLTFEASPQRNRK